MSCEFTHTHKHTQAGHLHYKPISELSSSYSFNFRATVISHLSADPIIIPPPPTPPPPWCEAVISSSLIPSSLPALSLHLFPWQCCLHCTKSPGRRVSLISLFPPLLCVSFFARTVHSMSLKSATSTFSLSPSFKSHLPTLFLLLYCCSLSPALCSLAVFFSHPCAYKYTPYASIPLLHLLYLQFQITLTFICPFFGCSSLLLASVHLYHTTLISFAGPSHINYWVHFLL